MWEREILASIMKCWLNDSCPPSCSRPYGHHSWNQRSIFYDHHCHAPQWDKKMWNSSVFEFMYASHLYFVVREKNSRFSVHLCMSHGAVLNVSTFDVCVWELLGTSIQDSIHFCSVVNGNDLLQFPLMSVPAVSFCGEEIRDSCYLPSF